MFSWLFFSKTKKIIKAFEEVENVITLEQSIRRLLDRDVKYIQSDIRDYM